MKYDESVSPSGVFSSCDRLQTAECSQQHAYYHAIDVNTKLRYRKDIGRKSPIWTYPTSIWRPGWVWHRWSFADIFGVRKLESLCYRTVSFAWSHVIPWSRTLLLVLSLKLLSLSYHFHSTGSESLNASNTSFSLLPLTFSHLPNLHTFITSSLFNVLAVLALHPSLLLLGHLHHPL